AEGGTLTTPCTDYEQIPAGIDPLVEAGLTPPDCASMPNRGSLSVYGNRASAVASPNQPGNYTSFDVGSNKYAYLAPGVYCITDSSPRWQGDIESDRDDGVFLY